MKLGNIGIIRVLINNCEDPAVYNFKFDILPSAHVKNSFILTAAVVIVGAALHFTSNLFSNYHSYTSLKFFKLKTYSLRVMWDNNAKVIAINRFLVRRTRIPI